MGGLEGGGVLDVAGGGRVVREAGLYGYFHHNVPDIKWLNPYIAIISLLSNSILPNFVWWFWSLLAK